MSAVNTTRTLATITECLKQSEASKKRFGCQNTPLFNIAISNVVIDELHLMLRVTDILIRNLIWAMLQLDIKEKHLGRPQQFLDKLINKIRMCGLTFRVC